MRYLIDDASRSFLFMSKVGVDSIAPVTRNFDGYKRTFTTTFKYIAV